MFSCLSFTAMHRPTIISIISSTILKLHIGLVLFLDKNRLVGLVVKASTSRAEDPGFESRWRQDFFGVESYQ